jgi:hypothetical protein
MLPITRVVLFQHGVGYFERSGFVEENQVIELLFKVDQMNDLLKSLTTIDFDEGTFTVLNYQSEDPVEKLLDDISIDIPEKSAISSFLGQLKGTEILIPRSTEEVRGVIVGIEQVERKDRDGIVHEPHLAVLSEQNRLLRIPLLEVNEISFLDETIIRDLNKLLRIYNSNLHKNRKKLTIHATGKGKRRVNISYVIEVPVWKTSYRMVLPDSDGEKPFLQGWALVDNTTEDDWNHVSLSLVSGLPVSFIHDLYTPRYRKRPTVEVDLDAGVAMPTVERRREILDLGEINHDAIAGSQEFDMAISDDESLDMSLAPMTADADEYSPLRADKIRKSIQVQTEGREVGEFFSYDVSQPVEISRGSSALVPILQTEAESERVLIYNPQNREKNPMTAVCFKNSTGLTLEKGPVTVIESGCYAGEAMLDYMRKNDQRIIPYAIELGVTVRKETSAKKKDYHRISKEGNLICKHYNSHLITEYTFDSQLDHNVVTYLDHPFRYNSYMQGSEPEETTENHWRYKIELPANSPKVFEVIEVAELYQSIEVLEIAKKEILQLQDNELISVKVSKDLEKMADRVADFKKIHRELNSKRVKLKKLGDGQKRLRENIKVLGNSSEEAELRRKYVMKLSAQEDQIELLLAEVKKWGRSCRK